MKFIDDISIEKYNEFVEKNINCSIFQSPGWVKVKNTWGYKRLAVIDDNSNVLATAQILTRSGLWYLPRGPILDYNNAELLEYFLKNLKLYAKKNKAKLLKIDIPEPLKNAPKKEFLEAKEDSKKESIMSIFKKAKFKHKGFTLQMSDTIQPRFEAVTYLNENFETELPKRTHRLLKNSEKILIETQCMDKNGLDDLMFALSGTEQRKNITLRNKEYFENLFEIYGKDCIIYTAYMDVKNSLSKCRQKEEEILEEIASLNEKMRKKKYKLEESLQGIQGLIKYFEDLYEETHEERHVISSVISVKYGLSSEILYGGMNGKFSKIPAQYKVYVETMKKFFEMGAVKTSMGGVEGSLEDGLLLYKSHFNPNVVEHYGEFDYAISKTYKFMYDYGLPLRRKILKLIRR
ncbi:peptidoglycan bridge formation glycyltransferase FemA/FemB family protein [Gemella sp. zg-570]|uniref:lipid II:glycine glycyltransferase FemX n=1 Tax=Gemella sp. zg-570 TaxID=2840371 RepID=UPI001C0AA909|nr:peptidoglycan bridge formation glycyltransferase FemA/FemB family protein [Gemella sp. zg-570]QWQ39028.1 peptidoglycan bridge formation glycyltransferase FemA/FemB family protein [Gemella sp. zg-570]